MKKLALILAMVCFVLVLGAAQEFKPTVAVSGSATAKVGFNLDTSIFSLANSFSTDVTVTLIPEATVEKKGEGTYGYIKIDAFKITADSDDVSGDDNGFTLQEGKISAKIVSGPLFFQFMDESNATKGISVGQFAMANITDGNFLTGAFTKIPASAPAGSYFYAGYDSDMIDVTLKASTTNNYCTDAKGTDLAWYLAPKVSVTVAGATIAAGAIFGTVDTFDAGIGASVSYSMKLNDKISLVPTAGFDMQLADKASWAAGAGFFAKWGGNDEFDAYMNLSKGTCGNTYTTGDDIKYQGGAGFAVQAVSNPDKDMEINAVVQVNEQRGDDGLVPGLGADLALELRNITGANDTDMTMQFGAFANYKVGTLTPYLRAVYVPAVGAVDASAIFGLGVDIATVLPNTSLNLDYNSWNVLGTDTKGVASAALKVAF